MVQFIHQEAREKAAEIKLKTDEEFNIEKLRIPYGGAGRWRRRSRRSAPSTSARRSRGGGVASGSARPTL
jgi:hypothetical protein